MVTIEAQPLTQEDAGRITGLDQPRISAITRGRLSGFTIDRLLRTLNALGQDVDISVHSPIDQRPARLTVNVDSVAIQSKPEVYYPTLLTPSIKPFA